MGFRDINIRINGTTKGMRDEVNKLSQTFANGEKKVKAYNNSLKGISQDGTTASKSFNALAGKIGKLTGKLYLLAKAGQFVGTAVNAAMDIEEVSNKFNVALGENAVKADEFVQKTSKAFGLDPTNLKDSVATFSLLSRSMGLSSKNAYTLSTNTVKLALDLSSLANVPIKQAMRDLQSGLVGQSETVYKYGIDVTEAALKVTALEMGITKSVRNMSQGEKMALRYATMIRQTSLSQKDFARTIGSTANQFRIFMEKVIELTRAIGTIFLPLLHAILPPLNAIMTVLINFVKFIAKIFGYSEPIAKNTENAIGSFGSAFDDATESAKKFKNAMIGIDELNVISKPEGGGEGAIQGDFGAELEGYDNDVDKVKNKWQELADFISQLFTAEFWENLFAKFKSKEFWAGVFAPISNWWENTFKPFVNTIPESFKVAWDDLVVWFDGIFGGFFDNISNRWNDFTSWLSEKTEELHEKWQKRREKFYKTIRELIDTTKTRLKTGWDDFTKWLSEKKDTFVEKLNLFVDTIKTIWHNMWVGIYNIGAGIGNLIIGAFEWVINTIIHGINKVINLANRIVNKIPAPVRKIMGINSFHLDTYDDVKLDRFEIKEFEPLPKDKPVAPYDVPQKPVVPNLKEAVLNALNEQDKNGGGGRHIEIENILELDGEVVYESYNRTKRQKGYSLASAGGSLV